MRTIATFVNLNIIEKVYDAVLFARELLNLHTSLSCRLLKIAGQFEPSLGSFDNRTSGSRSDVPFSLRNVNVSHLRDRAT